MGELSKRRALSATRIAELRTKLVDAERAVRGKARVYMTGSFGRGEASAHSDLDIFILGRGRGRTGAARKRPSKLRRLDGICLTADLVRVTRELRFPEFSGDGRWLVQYTEDELTTTLGKPNDDVENTFTARLLLLLESRALLGDVVYNHILKSVVAAYCRDYHDHQSNFMPAFLANDILRMWRTLCVNYEATTTTMPEEAKAKRKLKNYKLKHSRMLTCYSALLYLLYIYGENKTVTPDDIIRMIGLTPTERLEHLRDRPELGRAKLSMDGLLKQYDVFLETTNQSEPALIEQFIDRGNSVKFLDRANDFGDLMFDALCKIGQGNTFYRLLVV